MAENEKKQSYNAIESYFARAGAQVSAAARAAEVGAVSPFTIEVRFLGGLTQNQMDAFRSAADRWTRIIVGDLPSVLVEGEVIDDVLILAQGRSIDGPSGILGQAGPTHLRPETAGNAAFLPAKGRMTFDSADLDQMEQDGTLNDVITHEMGHVLGIGTIWDLKGLLDGAGSSNPIFLGENAQREFGILRGGDPEPVPVANVGSEGTRDAHWRESVFGDELMSGIIHGAGNPLSRMTAASLQDMGYTVDLNAAEPYTLPDVEDMAVRGLLIAHVPPIDEGVMLPIIPMLLPEASLQP